MPGVYYLLLRLGFVVAASGIHERLVTSVIHSPFRFFDQTPMGRIVARFTKDMQTVDQTMATELEAMSWMTALIVTRLGVVVYYTPVFLWLGLAFGIAGYSLGNFYIAAQLQVKRYGLIGLTWLKSLILPSR